MLRGDACRLSLCVVHRRPKRPLDGPGCATPAQGDPCRNRTCVRCLRSSRPAPRRTGRGYRCAEGGGFEPRGLTTSTGLRNRAPATPAAPSQAVVSPVRFERTTFAIGGQRSVPLSYGEVAHEVAPGGQIQTDDWGFARPCVVRYTTRVSWYYGATRTGLEPVTFGSTVRRSSSRAHAPGGTSSRAGRNRTDGLGAPNAARYQLALQPVVTAARKGGDDPPPPGPEPGVLPVPKGASPEGRTPICGVRARPVTSYRRDARVGVEPGPLVTSVGD